MIIFLINYRISSNYYNKSKQGSHSDLTMEFISPLVQNFYNNNPYQENDCKPNINIYDGIMWYRRIVISLSCACLLFNMFIIIKTKQYVYNTLKLFLFVQLFTFVGQAIVLIHQVAINAGQSCIQSGKPIQDLMKKMIESKWQTLVCSAQGYINLVCYNISYVFAVFITLYVRCVINNTHKKFMKRHTKLLAISILIIIVTFFIPFLLSFFQNMWYSFGPAGFQVLDDFFFQQHKIIKSYFFYCGIISRTTGNQGKILSTINFAFLPLVLFVIHSLLIWRNRKSLKALKSLQQLNPRQWFLLQSGSVSIFLFIVQVFNFLKYILTMLESNNALRIIICLINCAFDLFPIILVLFYYIKYYKKGRQFEKNSILRYQNQSIVTNDVLSQRDR